MGEDRLFDSGITISGNVVNATICLG